MEGVNACVPQKLKVKDLYPDYSIDPIFQEKTKSIKLVHDLTKTIPSI